VAHDVDTKIGDVRLKLVFGRRGSVKIVAYSEMPFVGKVKQTEGPYTVSGSTISSQAIRGGTSVQYWFDDGKLMIRYSDGKTVRFSKA